MPVGTHRYKIIYKVFIYAERMYIGSKEQYEYG